MVAPKYWPLCHENLKESRHTKIYQKYISPFFLKYLYFTQVYRYTSPSISFILAEMYDTCCLYNIYMCTSVPTYCTFINCVPHTFTGCICRAGKNLWLYFWATRYVNEIVVVSPEGFSNFQFSSSVQ